MMPLMDWLTACQDSPPQTQFPTIDIPKGQEHMWDGVVKFFGLETFREQPRMFSGVQTNLKINDLKGWRVALCKDGTEITPMADFNVPEISQYSAVLVGAKKPVEDELLLAAIGRFDAIATDGNRNHQHNEVYWTCYSQRFCFSNRPLGLLHSGGQKNKVQVESSIRLCAWSRCTIDCLGPEFEKVLMVPNQFITC